MGEVFAGRYELIEPIGMGGMGAVWTVHDRSDGEVKAAKILRQSDAASLLRFVREQSVRISHPHVVTPQSWAGVDDRVLFTMPLVAGGSVADLLKEHHVLPLPVVGALLDQLLAALEAVHAAGVVHRDVKPANLLLEPTGRNRPHLRLTDFGVAVPVDEPRLTQGPMAIGSPGYMAPEQWLGADPDPGQDLYAVGRVGLEMLTGQRPPIIGGPQGIARGEDPNADLDLSRLPPHRTVAEQVVAVLVRASAAEPGDRFASAGDLRAALAGLDLNRQPLGEQPVEVPRRIAVGHHDPGHADAATQQWAPSDTATRVGPASIGETRALASEGTRHLPAGGTGTTRVEHFPAPAASARRSPMPGLLVLVAGLVALVAGIYLLIG